MCVFASAVFISVEKLLQPSLEKFMTSAVLYERAKEMVLNPTFKSTSESV